MLLSRFQQTQVRKYKHNQILTNVEVSNLFRSTAQDTHKKKEKQLCG